MCYCIDTSGRKQNPNHKPNVFNVFYITFTDMMSLHNKSG
jgi:hypothetical protein